MSLAPPAPVPQSSLRRLLRDLRDERVARAKAPYPPGEHGPSLERTRRFNHDPLPVLLEAYERYGPIFSLRIFHGNVIFMLGPEANHFITVSHADHFTWREGHLGDLIPLLGDGLLTIDGEFHRRSRRIMLPAFHRERIAAALNTMTPEIEAALARWEDGLRLDLYAWTRRLALRIAMRALFGLDPDSRLAREADAATQFEHALGFWAQEYILQILRGPGTPWRRMQAARRRLDAIVYDEIARRRRTGERGEDVLSLLLDAQDEDGTTLDDRHVRDQVMTLLFAGHDTSTSTIAFLFYELARHPHEERLVLEERDAALGERAPTFDDLMGGRLPRLDLVLDETLRLYPAAWIGPRQSAREFEFAGHRVAAGVPVNYSSWASHHLPDVWGDPEAFRPDRFAPDQRATIPKGAYVPFGGGSRICIGMRFGQLEIKAIVSRILRDFTLDLQAGFRLVIRQMPTIGPRDGMPVIVRAR
ncbi:MAG TPA: cytochrome P450 [Capillimicrobium sp.]|nr:cytochrome P450 [Capillimicrobium sp.]